MKIITTTNICQDSAGLCGFGSRRGGDGTDPNRADTTPDANNVIGLQIYTPLK